MIDPRNKRAIYLNRRFFIKTALASAVLLALRPAHAASPAFVAASTSSRSNPQGTPSTVVIPSHSNGDLLVIALCTTSAASPAVIINTPAGWAVDISVEAGAGSAVRLTMLSKLGNGSETSVDITLSGTVDHAFAAVCSAYSSASSTADITGSTTQESGVDIISPSVETTVAETVVIYSYCFDDDVSTDVDHDSDAGFNGTSRGFISTAGGGGDNGCALALSDESQAAAGASNTCVWSSNADDDAGCAATIAFGPSVAAGIVPILSSMKRRRIQ